MIPKALHNISLDDLSRMIGIACESKTLEFKRMMPAKSDKEAVQFLSAVTAFANSAGGDLVIGIDSEDGIATLISGIPLAGCNAYKLHLEQLLTSNVEPRVPPVAFHSVDCGNNNHVVVIRIPQSWQAPHRVNKDNKFYGRHSSGKYSLDVGELRTAFALRESVAERVRQFRQARLLKIMSGETPSQIEQSASLVKHGIPLPSFGDRRLINVAEVLNARPVTLPTPLGSRGAGYGTALDGVFVYSGPSITQSHGYGQ
jgi:predicted HTH transcriptional regulator